MTGSARFIDEGQGYLDERVRCQRGTKGIGHRLRSDEVPTKASLPFPVVPWRPRIAAPLAEGALARS